MVHNFEPNESYFKNHSDLIANIVQGSNAHMIVEHSGIPSFEKSGAELSWQRRRHWLAPPVFLLLDSVRKGEREPSLVHLQLHLGSSSFAHYNDHQVCLYEHFLCDSNVV